MDLEFSVGQMAHHAEMIRSLANGVSQDQATWKPDAETWSLLGVIVHLYYTERTDFRAHLARIPSRAGESPPIDQPEAIEREYNLGDLSESLQGFLDERRNSISWLQSLGSRDWAVGIEIPFADSRRTFTAGEFFASWVAHDLLHMRQLVELHWAYTTESLEPYSVEYAGGW